VSFVVDASAAAALHFADEASSFAEMEIELAKGVEAFTAPNFYQEVMEALRRGIRDKRTTTQDVAAWLTVLDSYRITVVPINPCAGSAAWLIAESLNISAYDAGYIAIAKARGLKLYSRDAVIVKRAPAVGVSAGA
jgi:predicted nucleic acid-binding protein